MPAPRAARWPQGEGRGEGGPCAACAGRGGGARLRAQAHQRARRAPAASTWRPPPRRSAARRGRGAAPRTAARTAATAAPRRPRTWRRRQRRRRPCGGGGRMRWRRRQQGAARGRHRLPTPPAAWDDAESACLRLLCPFSDGRRCSGGVQGAGAFARARSGHVGHSARDGNVWGAPYIRLHIEATAAADGSPALTRAGAVRQVKACEPPRSPLRLAGPKDPAVGRAACVPPVRAPRGAQPRPTLRVVCGGRRERCGGGGRAAWAGGHRGAAARPRGAAVLAIGPAPRSAVDRITGGLPLMRGGGGGPRRLRLPPSPRARCWRQPS